jgi:hypothetical protein
VAEIADYFYVPAPEFSVLRKYYSAILLTLCGINCSSRDLICAEVDVCEICTAKWHYYVQVMIIFFSDVILFICIHSLV